MGDTVKNIITSIGTSLVVSSVTFILGLKSGKNQSDRQILRNKYRDISVHFSNLLAGIKSTKPKEWTDYKFIKNPSGGEYTPLMREMKFNGESIELKKEIISKCESLEFRLMQYSGEYHGELIAIKEYVINELENHCSNLVKDHDYRMCTTKDTIGKYFREYNYGFFIIEDEQKNMLQKLRDNKLQGISFTGKNENGKNHTVGIYKNTLDNISIEDFLTNINKYFKENQNIVDLLEKRNQLIKETEKMIKLINKRVKEPFTFIETISGAITDIVKI